jgi:micrococcal nuclease
VRPPGRALAVTAAVAAALVTTSGAARPRGAGARTFFGHRGIVVLDGQERAALWNDGDTFRPNGAAHPYRVAGYNTLESFGPVHRWGTWKPSELAEIAHRATAFVASRTRTCTSVGTTDHYGRGLASCPEAARELVGAGLAMVYAVETETPDPKLLAVQEEAQKKRLGLWEKGVPELIVTSVHSADEPGGPPPGAAHRAYNRVLDPRTGRTELRPHDHVYAVCEDVCETRGQTTSCFLYVPFERRYKNKPPCLP